MKRVLEQIFCFGAEGKKCREMMPRNHHVKLGKLKKKFPPNGALVIQDDTAHMQVEERDARRFFVVGLIRRPCDFALSTWAYQSQQNKGHPGPCDGLHPPFDSDEDMARFENCISRQERAPLNRLSMAAMLVNSYPDPSLVHCWARTHSLVHDVKMCMEKFAECGGNVTVNSYKGLHEMDNMVSDHAPCSSFFKNQTTLKSMLEREGTVIDTYNLNGCCSE